MTKNYSEITLNSVWHNNPGLVQLLGLCPLLAVTSTVVNGVGLAVATIAVLVTSNVTVSLIRHWIRPELRIPIFVLVIASAVTLIDLGMNAYFREMYLVLGIFVPLIVTNCAIIQRAEAFASKNRPLLSLVDALITGLGFALVLIILGGVRELLSQGTLFAQAELIFGEHAHHLTVKVLDDYRGFLLAILPPGAFLCLGLLIALKNIVDGLLEKRSHLQGRTVNTAT